MKKLLAIVILILSVGASAFADNENGCQWETFADYEVFCYKNGIEPKYEEYEYYAENGGQCIIVDPEEEAAELERIMALALADN